MKSIYIKQSKGKRFDVFDENKKNIGTVNCNDINLQPMDDLAFNLEIVDDMIHIWSCFEFEIEQLKNTLIIRFKKELENDIILHY